MIDDIKKAAEIASAVAKTVETTESGNQVKEELGKTALLVTKLVNNALLPIAAVNFAFDKARDYFTNKFPEDMQQQVKDIPADRLTAPKPSIAGQALQGLAYSHEEVDLKALYLALLAKSMDTQTALSVHPSFVEIIRQLSAEEIDLLGKVLKRENDLPIVEIHKAVAGGAQSIEKHILDLRRQPGDVAVETPRIAVFIENWRRLGLVDVHYDKWLLPVTIYDAFRNRPEFLRAKEKHESGSNPVDIDRGILERTRFGLDFAKAVGMRDGK